MKTKIAVIAVVSVLAVVAAGMFFFRGEPDNGGNSGHPDAQLFADRALNVFAALKTGDFEGATRDCNKRFKEVANPEKFAEQWSHVQSMCGPLQDYVITHAEEDNELSYSMYRVYVTCKFQKADLYGVVYFDPQKQISDFRISDKPEIREQHRR